MDDLQFEVLRRAESMKLFEHNGVIEYGKWQEWWLVRYDKEKADALLAQFRASVA